MRYRRCVQYDIQEVCTALDTGGVYSMTYTGGAYSIRYRRCVQYDIQEVCTVRHTGGVYTGGTCSNTYLSQILPKQCMPDIQGIVDDIKQGLHEYVIYTVVR